MFSYVDEMNSYVEVRIC